MVGCGACGTDGCEFPGCHSHVVDVSIPVGYSWTFWPLKVRPLGCLKISGTNYPVTAPDHKDRDLIQKNLFIRCIRKIAKSCLSNHTHRTTWLPLERFSWNLLFEYFLKICQENSSCLKTWQEWQYFTWRTRYILISLNAAYNEECFRHKLQRKSKLQFFFLIIPFTR